MDHQDVLEQLEIAAVEDGGLDRLTAGDTPSAAAIAGHLAGCPSCATEFQRLERAAPLLRDVVRTTPAPELRDRTLAFVRMYGTTRGADRSAVRREGATGFPGTSVSSQASDQAAPVPDAGVDPASPAPDAPRRPRALGWLAGTALTTAAAVVISVLVTSMIVRAPLDEQLATQGRAIGGLEAVTTATLALAADPATERVELMPTGSMPAEGSLLFSPATDRLVVVASGLDQPPATQEYRCWVVIDGERVDVGRMNFADGLAFWVGDSPQVGGAPTGARFGVSLSERAGGSGVLAEPVIVGER